MSTVQRVAQLFGVVFILVAILGFVASGSSMEADSMTAPKLLGLFPVNLLHNVVHLLFGVWGLVASRSFSGAKTYGLIGGLAYIVLACLGVIAPDTFGMIPIGDNNIWLHGLLGVALLLAAITARKTAAVTA